MSVSVSLVRVSMSVSALKFYHENRACIRHILAVDICVASHSQELCASDGTSFRTCLTTPSTQHSVTTMFCSNADINSTPQPFMLPSKTKISSNKRDVFLYIT